MKCCESGEKAGEKVVRMFKKVVAKYTKKAGRAAKRGELGY
jgi:hypothetical protein